MLTWAKLDQGRADYFQASVATSREEYYEGGGEAAGYFLGEGSRLLGLTGELDSAMFARLCDWNMPEAELAFRHKNRVQAFALTMSAPKSVSLLFARGDELGARMREYATTKRLRPPSL